MAAVALTIILSFVLAALLWLFLGERLNLAGDARVNSVRNLAAYFFGLLPVVFVLVFFFVERL